MTVQYASDLHLEFMDNARYLRDNPIKPVGDILVLAGDIGYLGNDNYSSHPFWNWVSDNYSRTLVLPGNHEFYRGTDIGTIGSGCIAEIRSNVQCYYNAVVTIEDVDFIMCTLWSNILSENLFITQRSVSDFYRIVCDGQPLTANQFNEEHQRALKFLYEVLNSNNGRKRVVVSHHVPTALCMADEFKGSQINGAFVAELHDLIFDSHIDFWVYGHSHRNMPEIEINGTKMLCNQLGYVHHGEHDSFRHDASFEI